MNKIKNKVIQLLMFSCLTLLVFAILALIAWLYRHGSSAAFQLATGLLMALPFITWLLAHDISKSKGDKP
jgi:hypothetical protein